MIQTNPEQRPMMDFVLMKTVEAKDAHKMNLALEDLALNKEKYVKAKSLKTKVESPQNEPLEVKQCKKVDEDTVTVILDQNCK